MKVAVANFGIFERDKAYRLCASYALESLIRLNSPGAKWISEGAVQKLRGE